MNFLLLSTSVSRHMFRRLMSPSSGVTYCEDHAMSVWFITKVLDKVLHINTSGNSVFGVTLYIIHTTQTGLKCFKYYKIVCTCL
jgi:hypothetical protein